MYYRRKILLAILKNFGGVMDKIDLQKILLLTCELQKKAVYHFVPYKFGCYSFTSNADLNTMQKYGMVRGDEYKWSLTDNKDYYSELEKADREIIRLLKLRFENKLGDELIKYTYKEHPYYAINSEIAHNLLNKTELQAVEKAKPLNSESALYTIGYEGISLEEYINKLINYNIAVLCDVRSNPLSMKYGFMKSQLRKVCESVGIKYMHFPELGINSEYRKELKDQSDYNSLFKKYREDMLPGTTTIQHQLIGLLNEHKRIALTCFEADICQCHRLHLAKAVIKLSNNSYNLKHI